MMHAKSQATDDGSAAPTQNLEALESNQLEVEAEKVAGQIKLEQYRSLRGEILDTLKAARSIELYAVIGLSLYYAWIFSRCFPQMPSDSLLTGPLGASLGQVIPWVVPGLIPIFGGWRNLKSARYVSRLGGYLRLVESEFAKENHPIGPHKGWETYVESVRRGGRFRQNILAGPIISWAFWATIIIAVVILAVIGVLFKISACKA